VMHAHTGRQRRRGAIEFKSEVNGCFQNVANVVKRWGISGFWGKRDVLIVMKSLA
jgi:hypothetical protein